jgi:hypothetical protein
MVNIIVCHPSPSSLIVCRRVPVATSDGQRRSVTVIDQLCQMVTRCARQRPPWRSSSAVDDKVHLSSSLIRTAAAILRTSAVEQQAPLSIMSSRAVIRQRRRSSFEGDHHGAQPSRRRCCAVTTVAGW